MSEHDEGFGHNGAAARDDEFDFFNRSQGDNGSGYTSWGRTAEGAQKSEDSLMSSGAARSQQPPAGQRSIFGNGRGPVFPQMPVYTPVTRGQEPRAAEPAPAYPREVPEAQPAPARPAQDYSQPPSRADAYQPQSEPPKAYDKPAAFSQSRPEPAHSPQSFPGADYPSDQHARSHFPQGEAERGYQAEPSRGYQAEPEREYQSDHYQRPAETYSSQPMTNHSHHAAPESSYPENSFGTHSSSAHGGQAYPGAETFAQPRQSGTSFTDQLFSNANPPSASNTPNGPLPERRYAESDFPDTIFGNIGRDAGSADYSEPAAFAGNGNFADASFPEDQYSGSPMHGGSAPGSYSAHGRTQHNQALQAFDAPYDQPPHIALGATSAPASQNFYHGDADFLDEQIPAAEAQKPRSGRGKKSVVMVASALLGAIALGGALAFAYKQSGGAIDGEPPVIQADNTPVKEAPADPGGKAFPNKSKLIYDRLQNGDQPEAERIVSRQEDLAMPAMPGSEPVAAPPATVDEPGTDDGGPRRVKTLVVRPDGSVAEPDPATAAPQQQMAAAPPAAAAPAAAPTAPAAPPAAAAPAPAAPEAPPAPAAAAPAPAADPQPVAAIPAEPKPAAPSQYLVQVGSKKDQTEALATFADMQQRYPGLLGPYRPMVQKANLGSKGTWYRLRIGPIRDKSTASKLCSQLKSQGLPDCLVVASQ